MLQTSTAQLPTPGDLVAGKYRVLNRLGAGGMGVVFEAVNIVTETAVAIKCLNPDLSRTAWAVQRFQREARATGRIRHPNVVALHDYGEHEGCLYLVMELLKGVSLRAYAAGRQFSPEEACRIMLPVMRGVAAAHAANVLHRDLKPDNIVLSESPDGLEPVPKVLDFGLARLQGTQDDQPALSAVGTVLGTYQYMAPEQLRPKGELDARVDVYALGAILYGLLTARLPYSADNPIDLALQILEAEPAPITTHVPSLPGELAKVVGRALVRDREQRYASIEELAHALEPFAPHVSFRGPTRRTPPPPPGYGASTSAMPPLAASSPDRSGDVVATSDARPTNAGLAATSSLGAPPRYAPAIGSINEGAPSHTRASVEPRMSVNRTRPATLAPPAVAPTLGVTEEFNAKTFRATLPARPPRRRPITRLMAVGGAAGTLLAVLALVVQSGIGSSGSAEQAHERGKTKTGASSPLPPALPVVPPASAPRAEAPKPSAAIEPSSAEPARVTNANDWTNDGDVPESETTAAEPSALPAVADAQPSPAAQGAETRHRGRNSRREPTSSAEQTRRPRRHGSQAAPNQRSSSPAVPAPDAPKVSGRSGIEFEDGEF